MWVILHYVKSTNRSDPKTSILDLYSQLLLSSTVALLLWIFCLLFPLLSSSFLFSPLLLLLLLPPVFPTTFLLFTFSPAPIQGKEESMQLHSLFSLDLFSLWIHCSVVLSQWMNWVVVPSCCHIKHLKASIVLIKYSRHSQTWADLPTK